MVHENNALLETDSLSSLHKLGNSHYLQKQKIRNYVYHDQLHRNLRPDTKCIMTWLFSDLA
jgi:hypothetical protein